LSRCGSNHVLYSIIDYGPLCNKNFQPNTIWVLSYQNKLGAFSLSLLPADSISWSISSSQDPRCASTSKFQKFLPPLLLVIMVSQLYRRIDLGNQKVEYPLQIWRRHVGSTLLHVLPTRLPHTINMNCRTLAILILQLFICHVNLSTLFQNLLFNGCSSGHS